VRRRAGVSLAASGRSATSRYAYGDAKEALRSLEAGHSTGKLVVDMATSIADFPEPLQ